MSPENELLPAVGVYVTETRDEGRGRRWKSITNVGYRPTFEGQGLTVETFLLDLFDGETPERIEVSFLRFVREERKFDSPELLRAQIMRDVAVAKRVHERRGRLLAVANS
jgi:riboflavin kinase/FMN adenylyltransferase